jgi:hypothetical protein
MVLFVCSPVAAAFGGDAGIQRLASPASVWRLQEGGCAHLRRFCRPEAADPGPEEHGVGPQPTHHSDICSVVHGGAFFGSQSRDAMVLQWLCGVWCLYSSSPAAASEALVIGRRQRLGSATDSPQDQFVILFCLGCLLFICHDSCPLWCCYPESSTCGVVTWSNG